jgi:uncharacterized protein with PhoU and TrkA domain
MKIQLRHKLILLVIAVSMVLSAVYAAADPGDSNDPLVTLSYITKTLMPQIEDVIDEKIEDALDGKTQETPDSKPTATDNTYEIITAKAGQMLIGDEGTEMILRSGDATIVSGAQGGVSDLTAGLDLTQGAFVPKNHLLLSPRKDTRGMNFITDAVVIVRGDYSLIR